MVTTVVVIDDDPDDIEILCVALAELDQSIECIGYTNPLEAVDSLGIDKNVNPTHIFIDINMPRMLGGACLKWLRQIERLGQAQIAIISTTMTDEDSEKFLLDGANFTFQKPHTITAYRELLRGVLRRA